MTGIRAEASDIISDSSKLLNIACGISIIIFIFSIKEKSMKRYVFGIGVIAVFGLIMVNAAGQEQAPAPPGPVSVLEKNAPAPPGPAAVPETPPLPFEGRIIVVYTKTGGVMAPQCLSGWDKARIGEQDFVSGKLEAYYNGMPAAGRKTWIAFSDIYQIVEYNEVDEFKQDVSKAWQMMRNWRRWGNRNDRRPMPEGQDGNKKDKGIF